MNIVVDASPLVRGQTGIGTYARELCLALRAVSPADPISFFLNKPAARLPRPDLDGWRPPVRVSRIPRRLLNRAWLDGRFLPIERWFPEGDVFHATDFLLPWSRRMRLVVTVHDLVWAIAPGFYDPAFVRYMTRWFTPSLKLAQAVLVPSRAVAEDLRRLFGVGADRVHVTPYGVSRSFTSRRDPFDEEIRARHGITESGYILAVGPIEPRKNLASLLAAYGSIPKGRCPGPLVVIGPARPATLSELHETVEVLSLAGRVILPGRVPFEDLPALYRGARLFAYPSLMEGFGLPVLEAMASGVPVVASRAPAIPETAGDAALLFDPGDAEEMSTAISRVLGEPGLALDLQGRGLERAREFTWERCAAATRNAYEGAR